MNQHALTEAGPEPTGSASPPHTSSGPAETVVSPPPSLDRLPEVRTGLSPTEIVVRMEALARRGKLAGFRAVGEAVAFEAACFGEPFDRVLEARASAEGSGTVVRFTTRPLWRAPVIFALVIMLTIWPGEWLTHSMLKTYFRWYTIDTWWWYLPLTVVPLVWMVPRMIRRSGLACRESAARQIEAIRVELSRV